MYDPIPLNDEPQSSLSKFAHHFSEGQRVRVTSTGHRGKITGLDNKNRVHVQLDSGHFIDCSPHEVEPEDFPSAVPDLPDSGRLNAEFARVLRSESVTPFDRVMIEQSLDKIRRGAYATDGLGVLNDGPHHFLKVMAEKYSVNLEKSENSDPSVAGFAKALKAGTISAADRAAIKAEMEDRGDGFLSGATFDALCLKYAGANDRLGKRATPHGAPEMSASSGYDPIPV